MSFDWPWALWALVIVGLLAALYVRAQRRRHVFTLPYSSIGLVLQSATRLSWLRRHLPACLYLLALAAFVVALARPHASVPLPRASGTVVLVVDASGSMAATDVMPSRIGAAQAAIREFVRREPKGVRIGVVAFSGSAYVLTPPTEDRALALGAVNYLSLGRGTNIGDALRVALETVLLPGAGEAVPAGAPRPDLASLPAIANPETVNIVLLSDGASTTGPNPLEVAGAIARAGIRTYTVGLGTTQGGFIPAGSIFGGGRNMQLDERTLKGIAETTGGRYFPAEDAAQLHEVYDKLSRSYLLSREETEVTFLPAAAGLVLLLTAGVLGLFWSTKLP